MKEEKALADAVANVAPRCQQQDSCTCKATHWRIPQQGRAVQEHTGSSGSHSEQLQAQTRWLRATFAFC